MKIDPLDVFSNALAMTPIRVFAAWLVASLGGILLVFIAEGLDILVKTT